MLEELDGVLLDQGPGDDLKQLLRDIEIEIMAARDFSVKSSLTWVKGRIEKIINA